MAFFLAFAVAALHPQRILNLGLPRSGTTFLHALCDDIGFRSIHCNEESGCREEQPWQLNRSLVQHDWRYLRGVAQHFQCLGDWPWLLSDVLANVMLRLPNVTIVATRRPLLEWVESARLHRFAYKDLLSEYDTSSLMMLWRLHYKRVKYELNGTILDMSNTTHVGVQMQRITNRPVDFSVLNQRINARPGVAKHTHAFNRPARI
jgi:hypothetical protein